MLIVLVNCVAVVWPSFLTTYLMTIIATYLTGVWEISITDAAAIVNIYWGVVGILPLALKLIVDAFIGSYWIIFISKVAFIAVSFSLSQTIILCNFVNKLTHFVLLIQNHIHEGLIYFWIMCFGSTRVV